MLDACRYDFFERQYGKHLAGKLSRKTSPGGSTPQWRDGAFPDSYDDIIYITSNPMINASQEVYGYNAGDHFGKIVEVWKDGWDQANGTVMPDTVTAAAIKTIAGNPGKRFVIHYLQPHAPYVGADLQSKGHASAEKFGRGLSCINGGQDQTSFRTRLIKKLALELKKIKISGNCPEWFLRKLLSVPPITPLEVAWRHLGTEGLKKAYEANLELVLEQVAVLVEQLSGTIVVTADHGELLGENRCYGHPSGSANPVQLEVPWLLIEKGQAMPLSKETAEKESSTIEDESCNPEQNDHEVIERLRALGYYD